MTVLNLPNPETPLAFLPPDTANQLEVSRYIYVASLGVRASGRMFFCSTTADMRWIGANLGYPL